MKRIYKPNADATRQAQLNRLWDRVANDPELTHADHDVIRQRIMTQLKPNTPDHAALKVVRKVVTDYLTKQDGQNDGR